MTHMRSYCLLILTGLALTTASWAADIPDAYINGQPIATTVELVNNEVYVSLRAKGDWRGDLCAPRLPRTAPRVPGIWGAWSNHHELTMRGRR